MSQRKLIRKLVLLAHSSGWGESSELVSAVLDGLTSSPTVQDIYLRIPPAFSAENGDSRRRVAEKIHECLAAAQAGGTGTEQIRVVILTALPLEAAAVETMLGDVSEEIGETGTIYRTGTYFSDLSPVRIAIVQTQDGNTSAAIETERALTRFHPDAAIFVGVAGGLKDEVQKGDVVVGNHVFDYSGGKDLADTSRPRIRELRPGHRILQRALKVSNEDRWRLGVSRNPRVFVKPIAAGPRLIASLESPVALWIKQFCGDALAIEMEGFGFLHAAFAHSDVQSLVVRGVSDLVDDKAADSDEKWQPRAAKNAAAFSLRVAAELLER